MKKSLQSALWTLSALIAIGCEPIPTLVSAPAVPAAPAAPLDAVPGAPSGAGVGAVSGSSASVTSEKNGPATDAPFVEGVSVEASDAPFVEGVSVEASGSEPRRGLSPRPVVEGRQTLRLRVETRAGMGPADGGRFVRMQTPAAEIDFTVSAGPTATSAALVLEAARSPVVPSRPEAPAPSAGLVSLVESGLVTLVGARGTAFEFEPPAGTSAASLELLESLNEALGQFELGLPDAPVGVGARWTERKTVTREGVRLRLTRRVTLLRWETPVADGTSKTGAAPRAVLRVALALDGLETSGAGGRAAGRAAGAPATLSGAGEGTITLQLDRRLPVAGALDLSLRTERTDDGPSHESVPGRWALVTEMQMTLVTR